jgi:hypothetical protein
MECLGGVERILLEDDLGLSDGVVNEDSIRAIDGRVSGLAGGRLILGLALGCSQLSLR